MIRQRQIDHKRKNSQLQLFHPLIDQYESKKISTIQDANKQKAKSSQNNKKLKIPKQIKYSSNKLDSKNILRLVQNSSKMINKKLTVIEDIDHNNFNNENDINNGNYGGMYEGQELTDDNNNTSFFQFGRRSRSSQYKQQKPSSSTLDSNQLINKNVNYELSMEEIMEVPDTMSNSRRYDNSNGKFYQFTTMLDKEHTERKNTQNNTQNKKQFDNKMIQKIQAAQKQLFSIVKKQQTTKNLNLNKRKQKQPKLMINKQSLEKQKLIDFSSISCNSKKKSKLLLLNNNTKKDDKKSKSKQLTKCLTVNNNDKQREKLNISTLVLGKKNKNIELQSQSSLLKKKSLSLKDKNKSVLKLSSQKASCVNSQSLQNKSQTSLSIKKSKPSQQRVFASQKTNNNISQISEKMQLIEQSQSKLQSQYKILFECVGQLWQNNRITRYVIICYYLMKISQKNKSDIMRLQEEQNKQESKFVKLKSEILTAISSARY